MYEITAELVIKLQDGDKSAFEELFELYKVNAVKTAYLLTGNRALADDVVQETFVQCYLKIKDLKNPMQFKTWFFKILTRIAWRMNTKEKSAVPVENIFEVLPYSNDESIENNFIKKETSKKIMAAIDNLDYKQRTVVLLYYYKEFSVSEIASILGCFEGTVKSRLYAARKNLKKSLDLLEDNYIKEAVTDELI
ncbi:MAG: RNA polymerase sigma factor [Proteocatella sp.]